MKNEFLCRKYAFQYLNKYKITYYFIKRKDVFIMNDGFKVVEGTLNDHANGPFEEALRFILSISS